MKVNVRKVTREESILEVETKTGTKTLDIKKTQHGFSYKDFANWDITDNQYYDLEDLVDNIMKRMEGEKSSLHVVYED